MAEENKKVAEDKGKLNVANAQHAIYFILNNGLNVLAMLESVIVSEGDTNDEFGSDPEPIALVVTDPLMIMTQADKFGRPTGLTHSPFNAVSIAEGEEYLFDLSSVIFWRTDSAEIDNLYQTILVSRKANKAGIVH